MLVSAAPPPEDILSSGWLYKGGTGAEMEEDDHWVREQVSFFRGCAPGKEPEPQGNLPLTLYHSEVLIVSQPSV